MKNALFAFALTAILSLLALHGYAWQSSKPLTQAELIDLLKNDVPPQRVGELATKKGIDFQMTPGAEKALRQAGADTALIGTLGRLAPKAAPLKSPTPQQESSAKLEAGSVRINPKDGQGYVWIPPGSFLMGCSPGDNACGSGEKPPHHVKLTKGFWMGQTAVTVGAWKRYRMATGTGALPTEGYGGKKYNEAGEDNMPAVMMTWTEAKSYCEWAAMRLPTEAEWEYAARAGTTAARYGDLDSIAWYGDNSGDSLHGVGQKQPNAWRLYDVLGNVFTWTADWYDAGYYAKSEGADPPGPPTGQNRVARGGSWFYGPQNVRFSYRVADAPGNRYVRFGCRCAGDLSKAASPKSPAPTPQPESPAKPEAGSVQINPKDGQPYVWIPPGSFMMGCSPGDSDCSDDEKPQHFVKLTKGFLIGQTSVTVAAWKRYRAATGTDALPTEGYGGKNYNEAGEESMPEVMMTWNEAKSYCEWAALRLPTEAEWEYAARAGTKAARYGDLDSIAWYFGNSSGSLHGVGQKQPNAWKLYDMLGNVYAWTADWYEAEYYARSDTDDPLGPLLGQYHVARGGSWSVSPQVIRLSSRVRYVPAGRNNGIGCRCAGELP